MLPMKKALHKYDWSVVIKYFFIFIGFIILEGVKSEVPLGASLLVAVMYFGGNLLVLPPLYIVSLTVLNRINTIIPMSAFSVLMAIIFAVYNARNSKPRYELFIYIAVSMTAYIILFTAYSFLYRLVITLSVTTLSLVFTVAGNNGLKSTASKPDFFEVVALSVSSTLFGLGICNLLGAEIWKGISVFIILLSATVYGANAGIVIATVLGASACLYYLTPMYLGVFVLYSILAIAFNEHGKYASCCAVILTDVICGFFLKIYVTYGYFSIITTLFGCAVYLLIPKKYIAKLKESLFLFKEKQLVRQTINRNRLIISDRLFEIAGIFTEIGNIFQSFKKSFTDEDKIKRIMSKKLTDNACKECPYNASCRTNGAVFKENIDKMTEIGFAKGKVTFIDVPKVITDRCKNLSGLIFCLNKLLTEHRQQMIETLNAENGRELIGNQAFGISEILKGLAMETCKVLKYRSDVESKITNDLEELGYLISECLVYGEQQDIVINIMFNARYGVEELQSIISKSVGFSMNITENYIIGEKYCTVLKKAPLFDAVFGISHEIKDGSEKSGDTHSVVRISENKIMVALCDGMGSGKDAENISDLSLSLIESFYKSGMNSNLILKTVNKVLAVNTDDTFSALDISVIDLASRTADFIKYGAPYGFIINDDGIKMIEGNSLPIGILADLEPTVNSTSLSDGDMLLFITDGISDAFGSSSEIIDFLQRTTAKNPQSLTDGILNKALLLTEGEKRDDMSALAIRIFKRIEIKNTA